MTKMLHTGNMACRKVASSWNGISIQVPIILTWLLSNDTARWYLSWQLIIILNMTSRPGSSYVVVCIARSEPDGTRWRTGGEAKRKDANGVGSQKSCTVRRNTAIQLLSADPHSSTASSRLNWHPRRFKWTRPFRWKAKSGFCACAITFRTCYTFHRHLPGVDNM